ncbi:MAG: cupin domain-containing protein [Planctomycetota bacterium]|jgi:quercetin dioxygenase-like cupin family protein
MEPTVKSLDEMSTEQFPWGSITWLVSGQIGNSETMTFGRVVIRAGCANDEHRHENCDEILHLLAGELEHGAGAGRLLRLMPGDTITLPAGTGHSARSVGQEDAVMVVAYSSAYREVRGE